MGKKTAVLLLTLVVLACAVAATHLESCDPLGENHHAVTSCLAGILSAPVVLGLMLLSLLPLIRIAVRPRLVLVSIDRPPRRTRAR